ncbi:antitoxin [candidate division KSB1 bacterium]|nr:antitoxin [candidate division KSB1 bacterium]
MQTAKVFMNGRSQAVRLPKEFRVEGKEVYIRKVGDDIVLSPKKKTWDDFFAMLESYGDMSDFNIERDEHPPQDQKLFEEE